MSKPIKVLSEKEKALRATSIVLGTSPEDYERAKSLQLLKEQKGTSFVGQSNIKKASSSSNDITNIQQEYHNVCFQSVKHEITIDPHPNNISPRTPRPPPVNESGLGPNCKTEMKTRYVDPKTDMVPQDSPFLKAMLEKKKGMVV